MTCITRTTHAFTLATVTLALIAAQADAALITPVAAFASSQNNANRGPVNTINNSGLSGPPYDLSSTHAWGEDNFAWQSGSEIDGAWIAFDLGGFFNLSDGHVWNYDQGGSFGSRGIRNMDVYVSSTDTADVNSALFTLAIDNQMLSDPNVDPVSVQSFSVNANQVRWVRFMVDGGAGVGNFGDSSRVGLFEVKFSAAPPIPEPNTIALAGFGVLGVFVLLRLRRRYRKGLRDE